MTDTPVQGITLAQVIVAAVILGAVAGGVVWYLERFQMAKLHTEMSGYLDKWEQFRQWESGHHGPGVTDVQS